MGPHEIYEELYARARGGQYGLSLAAFEEILSRIQSRCCADASSSEAAQFLRSLQIEDLALAHGCAAGNEHAWEVFLTRFRARLYEVAYAIARDESRGRELADGLYADLYGTSIRDGQRVSKLASYSGRGSLEGWLRTVLAQEFVNRYRAHSRLVSLDEEEEGGSQFAAPQAEEITLADARVNTSVDAALAELEAEERFVLAAYYLDGRKLSEIGRTLGVHESSISRRLDKITAKLRKRVLHHLEASGMSRRQAQEALEADVRDLTVDVRTRLQERREENPAGP
ncbi:MAG TPA: sigma-70 family RNA polymerase sigma factor [Terriglobales bacterium]|nr:sigma-70 family RNA polymerase sigma factor [Terriglobales bacterium]